MAIHLKTDSCLFVSRRRQLAGEWCDGNEVGSYPHAVMTFPAVTAIQVHVSVRCCVPHKCAGALLQTCAEAAVAGRGDSAFRHVDTAAGEYGPLPWVFAPNRPRRVLVMKAGRGRCANRKVSDEVEEDATAACRAAMIWVQRRAFQA